MTEYWEKSYNCDICKKLYKFDDLSTCDRCGKFVCSNCSEAVVNREVNNFNYDFLCNDCIQELSEVK